MPLIVMLGDQDRQDLFEVLLTVAKGNNGDWLLWFQSIRRLHPIEICGFVPAP